MGYTFPVFGCQLRVHLSKALAVRSVSGNFLRDPNVSTTPTVSESAARMAASTTAVFELVRLDDTYRPTRSFATAVAEIRAAMSSEPANPQEVQLVVRRTNGIWTTKQRGSNADGRAGPHIRRT